MVLLTFCSEHGALAPKFETAHRSANAPDTEVDNLHHEDVQEVDK